MPELAIEIDAFFVALVRWKAIYNVVCEASDRLPMRVLDSPTELG